MALALPASCGQSPPGPTITRSDGTLVEQVAAPMECRVSPAKQIGLLAIATLLVGAAYFCTTLPSLTARVAGWFGVAFFGLAFVVIPMNLLRRDAVVTINHAGIEDRRMKVGVIAWADIRAISIGSVNSVRFLCVDVSDPDKYLSRLPRGQRSTASANRALGFPPILISFQGLTPGFDEVWVHLQAGLGAHYPPVPLLD